MSTQQLLAPFRKAITDYNMINDGDKIAVGVSGGKDSLTLLSLLKAYQRFSPHKFELIAATIDMGFVQNSYDNIQEYCDKIDVPYVIQKTQIADIIFNIRKEKNPCSLCAKMRRGALNSLILEKGYTKLALGHHSDDVLETFLLSLLYEGRLSTFAPISFMDKTGVSLIRPMIFIHESDISTYAKNINLPVTFNSCPADKHTKRQDMKNLVDYLQNLIPDSKDRIFSAISHPERFNLWDNIIEKYLKEQNKD
ncbi:MAG: ATP-binding protein [Clostridia bacterium]